MWGCFIIPQHIEAGEWGLTEKAEVVAFTRCRESEKRDCKRDGGKEESGKGPCINPSEITLELCPFWANDCGWERKVASSFFFLRVNHLNMKKKLPTPC